ncbi:MAG: hypothetical protein K2P81_17515 [Bacteriovoracaceae bacterium]|nr:hypothetical protein [Bacteriovoracaceae bacterium]
MTDKSLDLSDVWVIKPVYYSPDYLFDQARMYEGKIAITSNMDHPLGQIIALHAAQKIQALPGSRVIPGGLLTHELYEDHPQKNWVTQIQKQLKPRFDGLGWGLSEELNKLSWIEK